MPRPEPCLCAGLCGCQRAAPGRWAGPAGDCPALVRTDVPALSPRLKTELFSPRDLHCSVKEVVGALNKTTAPVLVAVMKRLLRHSSLKIGPLGWASGGRVLLDRRAETSKNDVTPGARYWQTTQVRA